MATITSATTAVVSVTPTLTSAWLKDPVDPSKNLRLKIRNLTPEVRSRQQSVFYPLNAPLPVVVSGRLQGRAGSATVLITTETEVATLAALFDPARTLFFQKPPESDTGPLLSLFIQQVGEVSSARIVQPASRPERDVTFSYVEVAPALADPTVTS